MQVKTRAIVISTVRFNDKGLIVKCFTLSQGLKSYFVRDAFSSRKSSNKIAYFQPLSILNIEAVHKNKGTLEQFKEIRIAIPFSSLHTDLVKSTMVLFLSEILHSAIREEQKDESFFLFLETTLQWLDNQDKIVNFHLILLLEMTKFFGFYPDISTIKMPFFDLVEGAFTPFYSLQGITESDTNLLKKLILLTWDTDQKTFHVAERQRLLTILVDYYSSHIHDFRKPKSLEVLKEVFV